MKYYLTTPIYYVNAAPHIGHTYTTIAADVVKRFKKMQGYEVVLTTGTDEHGQKIERAAEAMGKAPQEFTDVISNEFRTQWETLGLGIDRFQRTTAPNHAAAVCDLFERCKANGYIYKGSYTGQYCISCELYVNDAKPGDPCPDCGRPTETVTEENYYFKLSAFQARIEELLSNGDFLQPETRRNEVLSFVRQGLQDLSISRTTIKWGIPVPGDAKHVFYVWFDALMTYISAITGEDRWPADLHLVGKEIVRFHAVYWPAFLWAAGLPIPKRVFAHGWLLFENDKMSKSRGNIVRATPIQKVMGADALRYFLLREVHFGQDGSFSYDALVGRYNSDLANGLGNLASRTLSMIQQYRGGVVPKGESDQTIAFAVDESIQAALAAYERLDFSRALEAIWGAISAADRFIVEKAPWKLAKDPEFGAPAKLDGVLYTCAETLRLVVGALSPILPESCEKIWAQLGFTGSVGDLRLSDLHWGHLPSGQRLGMVAGTFPRADAKVSIAKMLELEGEELARQQALFGKVPASEPTPAPSQAPAAAAPAATPSTDGKITIDDFLKVEMRVGMIKEAAPVKGADKLLHLHIDIGEEKPRSIVAGIAQVYKPEALIGRKVAIVANLAPRKMRGIESQGMIVAASLENTPPALVSFLEEVPIGARLK